MRDYLDIIKRNLLSPIVVVIFLLAGALVYVREYRDAWFYLGGDCREFDDWNYSGAKG